MAERGGRALKRQVGELLRRADVPEILSAIDRFPRRQVVNPLFSYLYHMTPRVRWHAVSAMGAVVASLFDENAESARVVMRRFIWNLNDESGGIGWGSPEAMGEAMARSGALADEYASILVSYIHPAGNYLEHPELQKGLLWGIGRLAHERPGHAAAAAEHLVPFLESEDAVHRGLAAWAAGAFAHRELNRLRRDLTSDGSRLTVYIQHTLVDTTVAELAAAPPGQSSGQHSVGRHR